MERPDAESGTNQRRGHEVDDELRVEDACGLANRVHGAFHRERDQHERDGGEPRDREQHGGSLLADVVEVPQQHHERDGGGQDVEREPALDPASLPAEEGHDADEARREHDRKAHDRSGGGEIGFPAPRPDVHAGWFPAAH